MKDLVIFLPGTMGSCFRLSVNPSSPARKLWYEDTAKSLSELVSNPSVFKWNPHVPMECYEVLSHVQFLFFKRNIYGSLRKALGSLTDYTYTEFPYDWREDIRVTAKRLGEWLHLNYAFRVDKEDSLQQQQQDSRRLILIGHSMGGLVGALAVMKGYIHPSNVRKYISVGTPFFGAPVGFKALCEVGYLPGMSWLNRSMNWRRDRNKCKQVLLETLRSFPSTYQLLPPITEKFVELKDGRPINPLNNNVLDANLCTTANETHLELSKFNEFLMRYPALQALFIYGDYPSNTDKLYTASVDRTGRSYTDLSCYKRTHGDGTVPVTSAYIETHTTARMPVVGGSHAYMCADSRVIELILAYLSVPKGSSAVGS